MKNNIIIASIVSTLVVGTSLSANDTEKKDEIRIECTIKVDPNNCEEIIKEAKRDCKRLERKYYAEAHIRNENGQVECCCDVEGEETATEDCGCGE